MVEQSASGSALTADQLLAGAAATYTIDLPRALLGHAAEDGAIAGTVVVRPLKLRDVERITRAAKEQKVLTSALTVQVALVEPRLSVEQVSDLPAGLVQFLLEKVNAVSGLSLGEDELDRAVKAPLAKACFVLAREFGWTPAQCSDLTVGQVLLYLEMLARHEVPEGETP